MGKHIIPPPRSQERAPRKNCVENARNSINTSSVTQTCPLTCLEAVADTREGDGGYSPSLGRLEEKILRKINKNKTKRAPFKIKWTKSRDFSEISIGLFLRGAFYCRILIYIDDQA